MKNTRQRQIDNGTLPTEIDYDIPAIMRHLLENVSAELAEVLNYGGKHNLMTEADKNNVQALRILAETFFLRFRIGYEPDIGEAIYPKGIFNNIENKLKGSSCAVFTGIGEIIERHGNNKSGLKQMLEEIIRFVWSKNRFTKVRDRDFAELSKTHIIDGLKMWLQKPVNTDYNTEEAKFYEDIANDCLKLIEDLESKQDNEEK